MRRLLPLFVLLPALLLSAGVHAFEDTPLAVAANGQLPIGKSGGYDPVIAALTAGSGITITNAAGSITITHAAHTGDVTGATELAIAALAVTEGKLANGAATEEKLGSSAVSQGKLKTSTQQEYVDGGGGSGLGQTEFASAGSYGFYPQVKVESGGSGDFDIGDPYPGQAYKTLVYIKSGGSPPKKSYAQLRFVY